MIGNVRFLSDAEVAEGETADYVELVEYIQGTTGAEWKCGQCGKTWVASAKLHCPVCKKAQAPNSVPALSILPIEEIIQLVAGIAYKPGAKIYVGRTPVNKTGTTLVLRGQYPDRETGDPRVVISSQQFEGLTTPEAVYAAAFHLVMHQEKHEAQEFFTVGGVRIYDPHAKGGEAAGN